MYLLDTDVLSNLMKRSPSLPLMAKVASVPPQQPHTSSITLGELIYGANRLGQRSTKLLDKIEKIVANLSVLPFDATAAKHYGEVRALLESWGTPVGDADLRIAAIALARGLTVVTANTRHFQRIPNLAVENWIPHSSPAVDSHGKPNN